MALQQARQGGNHVAYAEQQDITRLDDPALIAERRRVRDELQARPTPALSELYERLDSEFIRRAGIAWNAHR